MNSGQWAVGRGREAPRKTRRMLSWWDFGNYGRLVGSGIVQTGLWGGDFDFEEGGGRVGELDGEAFSGSGVGGVFDEGKHQVG